jgi:hypothetical protein
MTTTITALYQAYAGRAPEAAELSYWKGAIQSGNEFVNVRNAILNHPIGDAHMSATITELYETYAGRAPEAAELNYWKGALRGGAEFTNVRTAILDHPIGQTHTEAMLSTLYQEYFGRGPNADEVAVWKRLILEGADFEMVTVELMRHPLSAGGGVDQLLGTAGEDDFELSGAFGHIVISGFNPAADDVILKGTAFQGTNPLDSGHARQIIALDGTPQVLITFDGDTSILFENTRLDQLQPSDFMFG